MGRAWYEDGKYLKKKNTFLDFIACAEFLIKGKYTSPSRLAINGASAGGMLIGAVCNMRPDLFHAAVLGVRQRLGRRGRRGKNNCMLDTWTFVCGSFCLKKVALSSAEVCLQQWCLGVRPQIVCRHGRKSGNANRAALALTLLLLCLCSHAAALQVPFVCRYCPRNGNTAI